MKRIYFGSNMMLLRTIWFMNRKKLGELLNCTEKQIGGYERGDLSIPPAIIFDLEEKTSIPAYRLYYEELTKSAFPLQPLSRPDNHNATALVTPPSDRDAQYFVENLSVTERLKRLEMKVFGE